MCQEPFGLYNPIEKEDKMAFITNMAQDNQKRSALDRMLGEKVEKLLNARGLKFKPFAEKVGIDPTQFRRLRKGTARWNTWHIEVVSKGLGLNPSELLQGEEITSHVEEPELISVKEDQPSYLGFLSEHAMIPLLNVKVAGGLEGYLKDEPTEIENYFPFKRHWLERKLGADLRNEGRIKRLVLLRVAGDSMEPTIYDDEVVLVDLFGEFVDASQIINKKVYLVRWGREEDGISVKRLHLDEKEGLLIATSDNPLYRPKEILVERELAYYVLGRVIWVGKENI